MRLNHEETRNLNVVNLFEDDHGVVYAVNLWCVCESEVNAELSEDHVHLNDDKLFDKVRIVDDDVIHVKEVVSQDVDVRVDAEVTGLVTVSASK